MPLEAFNLWVSIGNQHSAIGNNNKETAWQSK